MGWKGESRRHSLARRGIRTAKYRARKPMKAKGEELYKKEWVMYHGTGYDEAQKIEKEGLKQKGWTPIFITPDKKVAMNYAIEGAKYNWSELLNRKPAIFKIVLTEQDFEDMRKGREDDEVFKNIVEKRKKNLDDLFNPDFQFYYKDQEISEYEWYYDIAPDRLERVL